METGAPQQPTIQFETWADVSNAIQKSRIPSSGVPRLVVVCFCTPWNPTSRMSARYFKELSEGPDARFAKISIVNAEAELSACHSMTIHATPAVQFYWDGQLLTIRRPDWDDDTKFVGSTTKENWLELIRYARDAGLKHNSILYVQF
ncbi:hypothetical protein PAPYR_6797 [Paratrimastix pyriformis]|uniref:Thioredoxin domain-containing protein n=1 Tax=Paratrimastix pyriformis TaxID=342808 RepID=A0ABQ8UEE6_9EUKA|nr:hypothetical protein PAPYR_6797 [Paratrimastix pyriformis]